jgi:hypothetical protein
LATAFVFAAGSGFDRRAEDFDSVSDADAFFFIIHPLIKYTWLFGITKLTADTMDQMANGEGTNKTRMKDEFP